MKNKKTTIFSIVFAIILSLSISGAYLYSQYSQLTPDEVTDSDAKEFTQNYCQDTYKNYTNTPFNIEELISSCVSSSWENNKVVLTEINLEVYNIMKKSYFYEFLGKAFIIFLVGTILLSILFTKMFKYKNEK